MYDLTTRAQRMGKTDWKDILIGIPATLSLIAVGVLFLAAF